MLINRSYISGFQYYYVIDSFKEVNYIDFNIPYLPVFEKIPGLSHVYEHLMMEGWKNYSKRECENIINKNVCDINAYTGNNGIGIIGFVKTDFDSVYNLFREITLFPNLKEDDLEREKNVIIQEINEMDYGYTFFVKSVFRFWELMGLDKRLCYDTIGEEDDVNKITVNDLMELRDVVKNIDPKLFLVNNKESIFYTHAKEWYEHKVVYDNPVFEEEIDLYNQFGQSDIYFGWNMNNLFRIYGTDKVYDSYIVLSDYITNLSNGNSLTSLLREKGLIYGIDKVNPLKSNNFFPCFKVSTSKENAYTVKEEIKKYFNDLVLDDGITGIVEDMKIKIKISSMNVLDNVMELIEAEKDGFLLNTENKFIDIKYIDLYKDIAKYFCTSNMCILTSK